MIVFFFLKAKKILLINCIVLQEIIACICCHSFCLYVLDSIERASRGYEEKKPTTVNSKKRHVHSILVSYGRHYVFHVLIGHILTLLLFC